MCNLVQLACESVRKREKLTFDDDHNDAWLDHKYHQRQPQYHKYPKLLDLLFSWSQHLHIVEAVSAMHKQVPHHSEISPV